MARYKILAKANADIEKMYADGIKTWGLEQAQDYLLGLHDYFEFLADNPNIGINSDDLALNLQRFPSQAAYGVFCEHGYRDFNCAGPWQRNGL